MPQARFPLRLLFFAAVAIGAALLLGLVVATLNSLLEFYQRLAAMPLWLRLPLILAGALPSARSAGCSGALRGPPPGRH